MEYWVGKIAVITNSDSEIGINLIETLGEVGMKVIALCSNSDEFKNITNKLTYFKKSVGQNVVVSKLDTSNAEEVETVFENIHQYGNLNVLINITHSDLDWTVTDGSIENLKKKIDTNVSDIVALIRTAASSMIEKQNRGHIITISDCRNSELHKNILTVTTAAVSSINEILRHEFRYLNANIKTTHLEVKCSGRLDEPSRNMTKEAKDIADMVVNVLNTPENLQVHELWLDIVN